MRTILKSFREKQGYGIALLFDRFSDAKPIKAQFIHENSNFMTHRFLLTGKQQCK